MAVAEYYLRGATDPEELLEALGKIRSTIEANRSEQYQNEFPYGTDKEDTDVAAHTSYNEAVLQFQMKQYGKALSHLERLFHRIEPIEEHLAVRICFLLLDVYFALQLPDKAAIVTAYLDKALTQEKERAGVKTADPDNPEAQSGTEKDRETGDPPSEELLTKVLTLDTEGEEPSAEPKFELSLEAFTLLLHYYKAQLHLMNKSMKSSKREIKSALATAAQRDRDTATGGNSPGLFLKANLEYVRENYRKSIKLLHGCRKGGAPENQVLYLNNMGCAHFRMGKHNAASFYFLKALRENNAIQAQGQRGRVELPTHAKDRGPAVQYNLGLQLLLAEQPEHAFACFQEASLMYYNRPRLWLRLAECCVSAHVHALASSEKAHSKSDVVRSVVGDGRARRIVLPTGGAAGGDKVVGTSGNTSIQGIATADALSHHPHPSPRTDPGPGAQGMGTPRFGTLSLEYAVKCLRNCLFLLSQPASDATAHSGTERDTPEPEPEPASGSGGSAAASATSPRGGTAGATGPSEEELRRQKEVLTVKQAALVYQAYVALSLDDPLSSLAAATDLLHMPPDKVTPGNRYLAHTYAAEALCMLDRPGQAEKHLAPTLVSRESYPPGSTSQDAASHAAGGSAPSGEGGLLSHTVVSLLSLSSLTHSLTHTRCEVQVVAVPGREEEPWPRATAASSSTSPGGRRAARRRIARFPPVAPRPRSSRYLFPHPHTHTHLRATPACISAYLSLTRSAGQI